MSKHKKRRGLLAVNLSRRTKIIVIATAVVVIVLAIAAIVLVILANNTKPTVKAVTGPLTDAQKQQLVISQAQQLSDIDENAQEAIGKGNTQQTDAIYQSAVKSESDPTMKQKILIDDSRLYLSVDNDAKALTIAKSAESLQNDKFLIADWLSQLYYTTGQYALSAQYYTLAGTWATSANNPNQSLHNQAYYDQEAAAALNLAKDSKS